MDQHTRLLKEMNCKKKKPFYSGATDEFEPDDQEEDDSTTPSVWREGICSNMECTNAIGQHNYALQQYLERSMVTIARIIQQLKPMGTHLSKETRLDMLHKLSQSLRDQLQSYHMPGARPMETEKKALCCSLLKGRMPAKELERVASNKPKYNPPKEDKDKKKADLPKDATKDGGRKKD